MVKRSLRHPIRGDRRYPKPPRQTRRGTKRSRQRQPRMRPRKSVNVAAALVGSPEEEVSRPSLRLRVVGIAVLVLFVVLIVRLWTLQVIDSKTYAAQVSRNQVRVVTVSPSRGEIVDRNDTVLSGSQPLIDQRYSHMKRMRSGEQQNRKLMRIHAEPAPVPSGHAV